MVEAILQNSDQNVVVLGIASQSLDSKTDEHYSRMKGRRFYYYRVPSTAKGVADAQITVSLTRMLDSNEYSKLILVTQDHFGRALAEVLPIMHCTTAAQAIKRLR